MKQMLIVLVALVALGAGSSVALALAPGAPLEPSVAHAREAGLHAPAGGLFLLALIGIGAIGVAGGLAGFLLATGVSRDAVGAGTREKPAA